MGAPFCGNPCLTEHTETFYRHLCGQYFQLENKLHSLLYYTLYTKSRISLTSWGIFRSQHHIQQRNYIFTVSITRVTQLASAGSLLPRFLRRSWQLHSSRRGTTWKCRSVSQGRRMPRSLQWHSALQILTTPHTHNCHNAIITQNTLVLVFQTC